MILPNILTPAITHKHVSILILSRITNERELLLWKTLEFLLFHSSHTVSKVRDAKALRCRVETLVSRFHHSMMLSPAHCLGWIP
jgi:hypothetical protein